MKIFKRVIVFSFLVIPLAFVLLFSFIAYSGSNFGYEFVEEETLPVDEVYQIDGSLSGVRNNRFRKSESGLYEMYVEGSPIERGVFTGKLSRELILRQEEIFISMINRFVPGSVYKYFLKNFIYMFNRSIPDHVPTEFLVEIYGVSREMGGINENLGSPFLRMLNYHAAHDIGHMLENMNLVGCTAFSVKGEKSIDGDLITGRNFDFYIGDRFSKEKIVSFVSPEKGIPFMYITWGGMTGVVSGLNKKGLSVVINAAESEIPFSTATPVSIVAREVLQYAQDIDKALEIILSRDLFVSQIFFISSSHDNRSAIIEKRESSTEIYYPQGDIAALTNHFTGKLAGSEKKPESQSIKYSKGRLKRVVELIEKNEIIDEQIAVGILRDTSGLGGEKVEPGSEYAINQYLAHHSVVFNNTKKIAYVSTSPWQFGKFVAYELDKVFRQFPGMDSDRELTTDDLTIEKDPFMETDEFKKVKKSRDDGTFKTDDIRFRKDGLNI
jgi:isopenicillin-N N-acyltransferase like protein